MTTDGVGTVLISGVRVRLTGEQGGIEVMVRAESIGPCSVRLALRRLVGERDGELPVMPDLTDLKLEDMDVWERWLELELTESEVGGNSEATYRFLLEPGSLWQVGAVGVSQDGTTGNAVCIQLRAPTEVEMAQFPRRSSAPEGLPRGLEAATGAASASEERSDGTEDAEDEVWVEAGFSGSRDDGKEEALSGAEVWALTTNRRPSGSVEPEGAEGGEASETCEEAGAEGSGKADSNPESQAALGAEAKSMPDGSLKSERNAAARRGFLVKESAPKRLARGPEVHRVISYKGDIAAEYARKLEEKHRVSVDKVPHRFETTGSGERRSVVQPKLTVMTKQEPSEAPTVRRLSAELLDRGRQAQQMMRLKEDARCAAGWIHAVTGDVQAHAAAQEDECSLLAALDSGEALCDLVNAVWPGRIIGILRGRDIKPYKRLANVTRFLQACSDLGIPDQNVFMPSDLTERKNLRNVVRCLFALGSIVPEPPEYSGPRLEDSVELLMAKTESCQEAGVGSGNIAEQSADDLVPRRATE
uniref:Calponin-homology (CH) domain-containing protein n=1 Tax=Alexandrium catenella TaxID=2925 RepID=A0A7S1L217_ALECA|mmetsp:Transcript_104983/g.279305  ORF Transcript_104983/g.279305 Transcript_104983/m.279305 type:complete len:531 (+) Transcript_104983:3-1595(+)